MPGFNPNDYETVDDRLHKFWSEWPDGRIETELVSHTETQFIVKAHAYRLETDEFPAATGYAEERVGTSTVNKTSALENCETSAIGRALANLGLSPKGSRPSREEMGKAERSKPRLDGTAADALANTMSSAPSLQVLAQLAEKAATYEMPDDLRAALRDVYLTRKHELEGVKA